MTYAESPFGSRVSLIKKRFETKAGVMDTKTRPLYMLSTRDPPHNKGHIQTKSEGLERNISRKRRPKESMSHNTHIR